MVNHLQSEYELNKHASPVAVIFCPSQGTSLSATLSSRNWKSIRQSCQTDSGSPKYLMGNEARVANKLVRESELRFPHRIGTTELFSKLVKGPSHFQSK